MMTGVSKETWVFEISSWLFVRLLPFALLRGSADEPFFHSSEVVQQDIAPFGGDPSLVTLAGQSSGAQMVKALLSTPSASNLFNRAILHSAPLDYSPQSPALANAVGKTFLFDIVRCGQLKKACLFRTPRDTTATHYSSPNTTDFFTGQSTLQTYALGNAFGPGVSFAEPFNIVADGDLVAGDGQQVLDSNKQIIFTTVKDEGCAAVGLM